MILKGSIEWLIGTEEGHPRTNFGQIALLGLVLLAKHWLMAVLELN